MDGRAPVSVVLSVLNEGRRLRETIDSIVTAAVRPAEIIVVDDGSTDGCAEGLEAHVPLGLRFVLVRRPHEGIATARQAGASIAAERILVFLDAHCETAPDWLEPMVETLSRNPQSIAVPSMADTKRPADCGCGARLVNDVLAYQWITRKPPPAEVGIAPGGCFTMDRDTLGKLGGFASMRDFGLEDVELSFRAWRFGCPILTVPESRVLHDFRHEAPYSMRAESWLANLLLTALLHFDSERIERTLRAAAGFASFPTAITAVLSSPWLKQKKCIDARAVRPLDAYWAAFPLD